MNIYKALDKLCCKRCDRYIKFKSCHILPIEYFVGDGFRNGFRYTKDRKLMYPHNFPATDTIDMSKISEVVDSLPPCQIIDVPKITNKGDEYINTFSESLDTLDKFIDLFEEETKT